MMAYALKMTSSSGVRGRRFAEKSGDEYAIDLKGQYVSVWYCYFDYRRGGDRETWIQFMMTDFRFSKMLMYVQNRSCFSVYFAVTFCN